MKKILIIICFLMMSVLAVSCFTSCNDKTGTDAGTSTAASEESIENNTEGNMTTTEQITELALEDTTETEAVNTTEETTIAMIEDTTDTETEEATTVEATTEEETTEETTTEAETEPPVLIAGENSGLTRDGTPKKYFTLSFDDGITQDLKIIEILKKYDMPCTFNINTGLYGANWTWVAGVVGVPGLSHLRFTKAELLTGIYDGYDVEVHTLTHPSLKKYDTQPKSITREVGRDAGNITAITGIKPVGMAWPGGDTEYTDKTIDIVMETTDIRFGRGITSTHNYKLPQYFMKWMPTCSITDGSILTLAKDFINANCTEDMLFYVWGHGYELDAYNKYGVFEELVKMMSEADDVVCVTNAEFYQLFKDEIPSWKE